MNNAAAASFLTAIAMAITGALAACIKFIVGSSSSSQSKDAALANSTPITEEKKALKPASDTGELDENINMKEIKLLLAAAKEKLAEALTPELKREVCEDVKELATEHLTGATQQFALFLINKLEGTIAG